MSETKVTAPVDTETFDLNITLETDESVKIQVHYPKGRGLVAIQALAKVSDNRYLYGLLSALRHDASVAAHLKEQHLGFDDEDDEL